MDAVSQKKEFVADLGNGPQTFVSQDVGEMLYEYFLSGKTDPDTERLILWLKANRPK